MKFDRHIRYLAQSALVGPIFVVIGTLCGVTIGIGHATPPNLMPDNQSASPAAVSSQQSDPNAEMLVLRTIERLTLGDAFDAKLRQRVWVSNRVIPGVGHYEQSGRGTGRYSLEMTIHDGDTRQTMKQISDGKLAWHRSQIGHVISVRRVDLGRIDEHQRQIMANRHGSQSALITTYAQNNHTAQSHQDRVPARLLVGGLVELIERINADYVLKLKKGTVERQPVWFVHGKLRESVRSRIIASSNRDRWAPLCPVEVRVAIAATADATGFGAGLPLQIEFYSEPDSPADSPASKTLPTPDVTMVSKAGNAGGLSETESNDSHSETPQGRIISLLEIYSMRRIDASPEERFRFISDDREVNFSEDTPRYLERISSR